VTYLPRIVDEELADLLQAVGGVVVEGPKACGKTETARRLAASEVRLDIDVNARATAAVEPSLLLAGATPRLLDEWQLQPSVWNHVRRAIDDRGRTGQFILTGSAVPADDITRHTGAGRIARLRMRPMTLLEAQLGSGAISLAALLAGAPPRSPDPGLAIPELARAIAVGGWPGLHSLAPRQALRAVRDYLDEIRRTDVQRVEGGIRRDPERVGRLLRSLARNVATPATLTTLASDAGGADGPLKDDTVREYLDALGRLLIVEDQPAWAPHLRSRYALRNAPKRHFVDPSLAVAALRATPERLLEDIRLLGLLFESLVVRDLRVYAQACDAQVLHYRDSDGLEVDAIVQRADGTWGAFEIKLGATQAEEAAAVLQRFARRIDTDRCGEPAVLGVIVGAGYGYRRKDGIAVIPIGALGP
jgi:predicted AAA+ superfamily ATPase